jgi:leukotriene-A4 hydrolase
VSPAIRIAIIYPGLSKFVLGAKHKVMGSALRVPLIPGTKGFTAKVTIFYKTTKDSTALQWLAKE